MTVKVTTRVKGCSWKSLMKNQSVPYIKKLVLVLQNVESFEIVGIFNRRLLWPQFVSAGASKAFQEDELPG